jgi:GNAT superfamily N-acetyltransferase
MATGIRAPRTEELERLREIEWAAGSLFAGTEFAQVADHEPASAAELARYARDGRAWVAIDDDDRPVGYAIVDVVDGNAHLEQLSVLPDHGRRGLGGALVEHVCTWAGSGDFDAVTLTTFADVAWNQPFYAKHGFVVMTDTQIGPELHALLALEAEHGLDQDRRVCMRRAL